MKPVSDYTILFYSCILVTIIWTIITFNNSAHESYSNIYGWVFPDVVMDQVIMLVFGMSFLLVPFVCKHMGWVSVGVKKVG